jgi:biotin synthase
MLSRVTWPVFPVNKVVNGIRASVEDGTVKRVCIQSLNYPQAFGDILKLVKEIRSEVDVPVSVSSKPLTVEEMRKWANTGVSRVSIALDAATQQIFDNIKGEKVGGPYSWDNHREALKQAVNVFGEGHVSTHLIVGLGETEKEFCETVQWCVESGVYPGLFAFTPIRGTVLENSAQPLLGHYRRVQVAHYLITRKETCIENMDFNNNGCIINFGVPNDVVHKTVDSGEPFVTSGCPNCNRPYYNEKPGSVLFNYPRKLFPEEVKEIKKMLGF